MPAPLSPEERSLVGQIGANESWARTVDRSARTAPARASFLDRFERQVDPDGILSPPERARLAQHARSAYFQRLAYQSVRARAARARVQASGGAA